MGEPDFQLLLDNTQCPFARRSAWLRSPAPDGGLTIRAHLERALPSFRAALQAVLSTDADGYVLQLPANHGETAEALRSATLESLRWLGAHSAPATQVTMPDLENPEWWFSFDAHRLFPVSFGDCFGPAHTRHQFGADGLFIVLQHELAFARRYPDGIPMSLRMNIRKSFNLAGRPYRFDMGAVPEVVR